MDYFQKDAKFIPQGSGLPRSKGLHLTDIISSLEKKLDLGFKGDGFKDLGLTGEIGFWWEDVLETAFSKRHSVRIGEVSLDGVAGSPDGVCLDPGFILNDGTVIADPADDLVLEEFKCTWKSAKHALADNWRYMTQVKGYCHMLGFNIVVFRVCYLFGFYNGEGPMYREGYIQFSQRDLKANWKMLIDHAKEEKML